MKSVTDPLFSMDGKIAVVTGGMGQLGRQFSLALAQRGAKVVVIDLERAIDTNAERFGQWAKRIRFIPGDVCKRRQLDAALAVIRAEWGTPEVLINNAALDSPPGSSVDENGPFEAYPEKSWDKVMEVNVKGVFLCCQVFGGAMARAKRGSIINVASIYGVVSPDQRIYEYRRARTGRAFYKPAAYSTSKSALINFTRYLATYWAPEGLRVNSVTFAGVFNSQDSEFLQAYTAKVPLRRMAREDEYNGAIIFLASGASSYMTGANLVVDGGFMAW